RFAVEIYPCAALLGLYPEYMVRRRAAKYNPGNRKVFSRADWNRVCELIGATADELGIDGLSNWTRTAAGADGLRKSDQDCLDATICVVITVLWWRFGYERCITVGDLTTGYIVTPSHPAMTDQIRASAAIRDVPVRPLPLP
ncbi:MAG: hypothetical protein M3Y37_05005, partial [Chloroflexota bacterium]|nr:hypothetical protein [Chloroflexota bacterium]